MIRRLIVMGIAVACMAAASPQVAVVVEHGAIFTAPATVRLRVTVQHHPANRGLWVAVEATGYSSAHFEDLTDGNYPVTRWVEFKDLPAGEYLVWVHVDRAKAPTVRATSQFTIVGQEIDDQCQP